MDTYTTFALLLLGTIVAAWAISYILQKLVQLSRKLIYFIAASTAAGGGGAVSEYIGLTNITPLFGG